MTSVEITTERIKAATDIVTLIGGYVKLKKTGNRFTGLCRFHQEETPSFAVEPTKGQWCCYGCGAWGEIGAFGQSFDDERDRLSRQPGLQLTVAIDRAEHRARGDRRPFEPFLNRANWACGGRPTPS